MVDDDMKLEALPQTNIIKAIITAELPMDLYAVYRLWCEDNALNALSAKSFSAYLIENADRYSLEPSNNVYIGGNKRARGFAGIEILQRPCY